MNSSDAQVRSASQFYRCADLQIEHILMCSICRRERSINIISLVIIKGLIVILSLRYSDKNEVVSSLRNRCGTCKKFSKVKHHLKMYLPCRIVFDFLLNFVVFVFFVQVILDISLVEIILSLQDCFRFWVHFTHRRLKGSRLGKLCHICSDDRKVFLQKYLITVTAKQ